MEGTPEDVSINKITAAMEDIEGVENVHHVHVWQLDEQSNALEVHVVLSNMDAMETIKKHLKPCFMTIIPSNIQL
tara:strand:+ start:2979 stop:3203 length:225 start_codon:yes stop_codon:yes gene_type:complete